MERTLAIIKPDAVAAGYIGEIIRRIEEEGLRLVGMKLIHLQIREAEGFYYIHRDQPFFKELVDYMTSGPSVLIVLEGVDVINRWRKMIGPTDPQKAPRGTIRRDMGVSIGRNAVHGSDSAESASYEINYLFKGTDLLS